jgi:hypothetical protein
LKFHLRENWFVCRIRIRAVNTIGSGPFSSIVKCQTKSLPPDAPRLECIAITCNSPPRPITYIIEMEGKDGK